VCSSDLTIADIIDRLGGGTEAARRLRMQRTTILQWRARGLLPAKHIWSVAEALGVPAETLRHLTEQPQPRQEAA
jgi:DNA-binding transcriptional MerR regulator